jgi:hypothetical protein
MNMRFSMLTVLLPVFFLAMTLDTASTAAPGAAKLAAGAPVVLNFPDSYSLGELYVLKNSAGSDESEPGTTIHSPARGRLTFPPGTRTLLKVSYDGAQHLSDLTKLDPNALFGINMKRLEVTDDDLKYVAKLTGLHHIELEGTDITTKGIVNLEPLKNLQFLGCDKTLIRGDAMKSIAKHLQLENLVIGHNDLDDDNLKYLTVLKKVSNLQIDNIHLSNKGLEIVLKLPLLTVLKISGNNRISDASIAMLQNTKIKSLNVQTTGVGPRSLPYFLKFPCLKQLKLEGRNFSPEQQREFKKKLPHVKIQFDGKGKNLPKELFEPLH